MTKLMLFIDGTWLYHSKYKIGGAASSEDYALDYGKLPEVISTAVARQLGGRELAVVRTHLFGSCAADYDSRDEELVQRQKDFFNMLKEKYHYEVEVFPIDFRGRRLRRADRRPDDTFEPREKCVDIALASALMYYAAIPNAYDLAVVVLGDEDFVPLLQSVRRLGKRVAVVSIKATCCPELADPYDEARVKDFDVIWLDDLVSELELVAARPRARGEAPASALRPGWSSAGSYRPRSERASDDADAGFAPVVEASSAPPQFEDEFADDQDFTDYGRVGDELTGIIKTKFEDRGYGFIHGDNGQDFFFHITDLRDGLEFQQLSDGLPVRFKVKKQPEYDKAGAAQEVRPGVVYDDADAVTAPTSSAL